MKLSQLSSSALRMLGNCMLTKAALAINLASAATIKTGSSLSYIVDGVYKTLATLAAQALTPIAGFTFFTQPENTTVYYVLAIDGTTGAVVTVQGGYDGQLINNGGIVSYGQSVVPDVPDLTGTAALGGLQTMGTIYTPFGGIKVVVKPGQTWRPGTDALDNATKATYTFYDFAYLPAQDRI